MAIAVAPTPVLRDEDAIKFMERVEADLKRPAKLAPTPKIELARKLIKSYVSRGAE
jgi:hypothetical protein